METKSDPLSATEMNEFWVDLRKDFNEIYRRALQAAPEMVERGGFLLAKFALMEVAKSRQPLSEEYRRAFNELSKII